ncbi:MAG: NAD(P)/FAD-dependent oxidoreductase [Woeseiaceae bacterium]|nr:NAD(P)/FAD-dependent oxidoreductase [Woeseiaceae bacterium]
MDRYDSIIIGAGHNGLVCAARLAGAGQRVLLLEAAARPGGFAAARDFHGLPASVAHTIGHFPRHVARELDLAAHGFDLPAATLPLVGLGRDRDPVVVDDNGVSGAAPGDDAAWRLLDRRLARFAAALSPFWFRAMPRIGARSLGDRLTFLRLGLRLRRLGRDELHEFLRIAALPVRDLLDEVLDDALLKAVLAWDGLIGGKLAPRSPNGAVLTLLYRRAGNPSGRHALPPGGCAGLAAALVAAAEQRGAVIRCDARVRRVMIDAGGTGLAATGVELADGELIAADTIVSSADPRTTFVDLVGVRHLDIGFTNRIRRLRCDGFVAKLHLALDGPPVFEGVESAAARLIVAPDMDALEFAYDDAKYGHCPEDPVMEIVVPTVADPSLAQGDRHLLSAHVMYVPRHRKGGWTAAARDALADRVVDVIARHAPAIRGQIVGRELLTPADLEAACGATGGHWHHTEFAIDQLLMMRPTYEAARYRTPIPGLWLCGAGTHPGGDLTGAAGYNAATEIIG